MRAVAASLVMLALHAATASADATDIVSRRLTLDDGQLEARFVVEAGIETGRPLRPLSLAPDVWWGVTERLTLGLVHSNASLDRIDAGRTFCVRPGIIVGWQCADTYRGSGLDARWSVREGTLALAPRMRLLVRELDPFKPAVTLGVLGRARRGRFAVTTDPYLRLGLANTDKGNRAALEIPVWLTVQPVAGTSASLRLGYESDVAVARDGWRGSLGLGVTHRLGESLEVGFELGYPALFGPQHLRQRRNVMLAITYRH